MLGFFIMGNKILIINGPNLNMLGKRQPEIYGKETLSDIKAMCEKEAKKLELEIVFKQSNHEGDIVDWIQEARDDFSFIIINPAAYTHTSVAIMDALLSADLPTIEVHLSNIHQRDEFRHKSFVSKVAKGVICGFGSYGYIMALWAAKQKIISNN
jgi:3-dehydroquinate dehydratase-2